MVLLFSVEVPIVCLSSYGDRSSGQAFGTESLKGLPFPFGILSIKVSREVSLRIGSRKLPFINYPLTIEIISIFDLVTGRSNGLFYSIPGRALIFC